VRNGSDVPLVYWHGNYQQLDDETLVRARRRT
jgi:hypothetical protein